MSSLVETVRACVKSRRRSREIAKQYRCTHIFYAYARDSERARAQSLEKISVKVATRLDDETDVGSSERRAWRTRLKATM